MNVRIRMYRQGLGDCFLLTFGEGEAARHVLIDCGSLGSTTTGVRMRKVVEDIRDTTGGHLHLLIATHEHKDHVSGFLTERKTFEKIRVDHVWLAWTENSEDDDARKLQRHQGDLITAAKLAAAALEDNRAAEPSEREATAEIGAGIRKLLAFFDEDAELELEKTSAARHLGADLAKTVHDAMSWVTREAAPGKAEFREPDDDPIAPEWLPGVRFYVLGPPRDPKALADLGHHGSPELYSLAAARAAGLAASVPFFAAGEPIDTYYEGLDAEERERFGSLLPFDPRHRLDDSDEAVKHRCGRSYYCEDAAWRRIDYDWLTGAADLALQLDGQTNNTSLALAIELIEDRRVLLFPADAQVGNWLSWHEKPGKKGKPKPRRWRVVEADGSERTVTAADLLRRTVFYKVGHHASHNATIREKGLEMMAADDLVAVIPVDRRVAMNKHPPWQMPARALYRRLIEKAGGRVLRSDTGWASRTDEDFEELFTESQWKAWEKAQRKATRTAAAPAKTPAVEVDDLYIDCFL